MGKTVNEIILQGRILHIYNTPKTALVNVLTQDYRAPKPKDGRYKYASDTPTVVFFDEDARKIASDFKVGDNVLIHAHSQSNYDHDRLISKQECWGDAIEHSEDLLKGLGKTAFYGDDVNRFVLLGKVEKVNKAADTAAYLTVRTSTGKYTSFNSVLYNSPKVMDVLRKKGIAEGATIIAYGRLSTYKKDREDGRYEVTNSLKAFYIDAVNSASSEVLAGNKTPKGKKKDIVPTIPDEPETPATPNEDW